MAENPLNLLQIEQLLTESGLAGYIVKIYEELGSTNTYALNEINRFANKSVIVCENQVSGLGRNGKSWLSRPYKDLTVSFVHKFAPDFRYELLPLVIAVAVNRLFKFLRIAAHVKWPNDIWLADKTKVAGILQAAKLSANERCIVTGIGLNNIGDWERNHLLVDLIKQIDNVIAEYEMFGFAMFRREWLDNCIHYHKVVSLYQAGNLLDQGLHSDLTDDGNIIIKDRQTGELREYPGFAISLIVEE